MENRLNIGLSVPSSKRMDRRISLRIKKSLQIEPAEYDMPSKILAISDIEGNYFSFRRLLLKNKVINNKYEWTFGSGHVIMVGDCFDRGEQVIECLWLIYSLEEKSRDKGGNFHFILGNHEIMNMNGDWRYIHPKYASISSENGHVTALYDGNLELWRWLHTKNLIEKIGNILFVHGGISHEILNLNKSISEINNFPRPYFAHAKDEFTDPLLKSVFNSTDSPFWYRGYYTGEASESLINATLDHFDVSTIVTGHTIVQKITSYFDGKVININTDHGAGNSEALLIKTDKFYSINIDGVIQKIK